jgi:hypothetical protein
MAEAKNANTKKVLYKGIGDVREISSADFKAVGIDHGDLRWDKSNLFMVPMSQITLGEEELNKVFGDKSEWSIVEGSRTTLPGSHPDLNKFHQVPDSGVVGGSVVAGGDSTSSIGTAGGDTL